MRFPRGHADSEIVGFLYELVCIAVVAHKDGEDRQAPNVADVPQPMVMVLELIAAFDCKECSISLQLLHNLGCIFVEFYRVIIGRPPYYIL